ncbi:hypothetical protein Tco_1051999 [Tanacetum coccineum]
MVTRPSGIVAWFLGLEEVLVIIGRRNFEIATALDNPLLIETSNRFFSQGEKYRTAKPVSPIGDSVIKVCRVEVIDKPYCGLLV